MLVPYDWQEEDIKWVAEQNRLLANDCGLGKTLVAVEAAKRTAKGPVLVIAPRLSKEWWAATIRDQDAGFVGVCSTAGRGIPWSKVAGWEGDKLLWVIVHPEAVRLATRQLLKVKWDTVIVDEAHRFKNRKAKQTKALWQIRARRKILLTATPYGKSPADLWALLRYLYPQTYTSYWRFFETYVDSYQPPGKMYKSIKGSKNLKMLAVELQEVYRKREKKDVLNLPPITYSDVPVIINGPQEKLYLQLQEEAYAELVGKEIVLSNALVTGLRLQQCALDPSILAEDLPKRVLGVTPAKVEWLYDWLDDNPNEPVVITTRYRKFLHKWLEHLAPGSVITGGMKTEAVERALGVFEETGILVGTLDAIKESLNLQRASTMIIMDGTYSSTAAYQLTQRIHRVGQTQPCQVIHLVGKLESSKKWTIDRLIRRSVKNKFDQAQLVNAFVKELQDSHV